VPAEESTLEILLRLSIRWKEQVFVRRRRNQVRADKPNRRGVAMSGRVLVIAVLTTGAMFAWANRASAQAGLTNRDRLFLLYNDINSRRNQRMISQQQDQLQRQFRQFANQQSQYQALQNIPDPIEAYVRQAEGLPTTRGYIPPIYSGGRGYFQSHNRYFNPQR
jgi:hypothetical protein